MRQQPRIASGPGSVSSAAVKADGTVWTWGENFAGQLGDGTKRTTRFVPIQVAPAGSAIGVAVSQTYSSYLAANGDVYVAGSDSAGSLGNGLAVREQLVFGRASVISNVVLLTTADAATHTAIRSDASAWRWGLNPNRTGQDSLTAAARIGTFDNVVDIADGRNFKLLVRADGSLWFWGRNETGVAAGATPVIGPSDPGINVPAQVPNVSDVVAVSVSLEHVLALKRDGTVWSWGRNSANTLGYPAATEYTSVPQPIPAVTDVVAVSAGPVHSLALRRDGTVYAWGSGLNLCLGSGATGAQPPTVIPSLSGIREVAIASSRGSLLLKDDGTVFACGTNSLGILGLGSVHSVHVPTPIPGLNLN